MKVLGITTTFMALVASIAAGVVPSDWKRDGKAIAASGFKRDDVNEDGVAYPGWKRDEAGEDGVAYPGWKRDDAEEEKAFSGKNVLVTGASMGIGEAIARRVAAEGSNLALIARSEDKLKGIAADLQKQYPSSKVVIKATDLKSYGSVEKAVNKTVKELGDIDVLINNAGLALGAPATFPDLKVSDIVTMNSTNINGLMFKTYAVLNSSMMRRKEGTILNVTSVTGLEVPPFPGEAVYHSNKAAQETFTNSLRNELTGTNIRVLALRP
ncbi:hypothetical protein BDW60DRAFT_205342 [Aspergillus nidulans var. acristatus]